MFRDSRVFLEDIVEAARRIRLYTADVEWKAFEIDLRTSDAVLRNLQVIGEATKRLPNEFRSAHPGVDWRRMAGMRDVLVHEYSRVNLQVVWNAVTRELPEMEARVRSILESLPND
jgi:uncharacterized protein with HEPN domain